MLNNAKVILKVALPLGILAILAAGLVLYSRATLSDLAAQTKQIVDVQATRLESVLNVRINVNEASIQARNILIETRENEMAQYQSRYGAAFKAVFENVDRLVALSDTEELKAANQTLRDTLTEFFAVMDRANLHGLKNENDTASKILLTEATVGRAKVRAITQPRIERLTAELRQARDDAEQAVSRASTLLVAAAAFGLLGALTLASLIVVFGITRPMGSLVAVLQRMAKGDTDAEIVEARRGDEIGAVGRAVEGIKAMVAQ
ncbi:MAG: HAMP domain-containing protein, partial [Alphaproteobacteria bacterium]